MVLRKPFANFNVKLVNAKLLTSNGGEVRPTCGHRIYEFGII